MNLDAFEDELIKMGAPYKMPDKEEWKRLGKATAAYGLGAGIGSALGFAIQEKMLKKTLPRMTTKQVALLGGAVGAASTWASHRARKKYLDYVVKNKK